MRFGGPVPIRDPDPAVWISDLQQWGYGAAVFPKDHTAASDVIAGYAEAARAADIVIAEVGAWSNPISPDDNERRKAISKCQNQLALADEVDARCCVNIAGSRGEVWDGPHPDNLTDATFALIVDTTREIIDAVHPSRTFYTLEAMPWMYPDSPDSYLRLIEAVDRKQFGVHLDPVNLISSPQRYFNNGEFIRECFQKLGPYIKNCHAKDITLSNQLTVHLDEVQPGLGALDYATFLRELNRRDPDTSIILEHLKEEGEYREAAKYVRSVAAQQGLSFVGGVSGAA